MHACSLRAHGAESKVRLAVIRFLRFCARNGMLTPKYALLLGRYLRRRLPTGARLVALLVVIAVAVAGPFLLRDLARGIRYAINHPHNSEPLYAKLRPGMKVTIAVDDISLPLPPMRRPDVRERVLTIVLDLLADYGARVRIVYLETGEDELRRLVAITAEAIAVARRPSVSQVGRIVAAPTGWRTTRVSSDPSGPGITTMPPT